MKVEYVPQKNDDLSVVNIARVSFAKTSGEMTDKDARLIRYLAKHNHWTPFAHQRFTFECDEPILTRNPTDPLLTTGMVHNADFSKVRHSFYGWLNLLITGHVQSDCAGDIIAELHMHMPVACGAFDLNLSTPMGNAGLIIYDADPLFTDVTLRMGAPVPIRTQCFKHKAGFTENEESRRYISSHPEVFVPDAFRAAPNGSIKQGSGGVHENSDYYTKEYEDQADQCIGLYEDMIEDGVCPEQARFILPQGCIVNWIWTGNLQSYARFYNQRTDQHAQKEVQDLAHMVGDIVGELYPVSWAALTGGGE